MYCFLNGAVLILISFILISLSQSLEYVLIFETEKTGAIFQCTKRRSKNPSYHESCFSYLWTRSSFVKYLKYSYFLEFLGIFLIVHLFFILLIKMKPNYTPLVKSYLVLIWIQTWTASFCVIILFRGLTLIEI